MRNLSTLFFIGAFVFNVWSIPAFPGAEGFGSQTPGGRGGKIVKVTNLNDNGAGSLRAACEADGKRIVVFDVCGIIKISTPIEITKPYITIAGETAPGGGITIDGTGSDGGGLFTMYTNDASQPVHDIIIRFIRVRNTADNDDGDAFRLYNVNNAVVDHCSFGWGHDETADLSKSTNITMQYCIFNESVASRDHNTGVFHCYGKAANFTMHHCLLIHHKYRNPVLNSDHVDLRNNVVYNWRDNATHFDNINTTESTIPYPHHLNVAGNYYKQGPNWSASPGEPIEVISQYVFNIQNNLYEYRNGTKTKVQSDLTNGTWKTYAPDYPAVLTSSPETAFDQVLNTAGSWPRDTLDKRNIREARTGTGGWCYSANSALLPSGMDFTKKAETDADNDGIPDTWAKVRLIPSNDPSGDADNDGYTNIEEYLQYRASVLLGTFTTGTAGPVHGANGPNTSVRTVTVALDGMPGVSFSLPVNSNTGKASLKILSASGKVAAKFSLRTTGSNAVLNKKVALQPGLYTAVLEGANYSARNRFVINE